MPRNGSATGLDLREGDTVLVEAIVSHEGGDFVSLRIGSQYGEVATVKPALVHTVLRRHFRKGEQVIFDNGQEMDELVYTIVAIAGDYAWLAVGDGPPETRRTTMLRPVAVRPAEAMEEPPQPPSAPSDREVQF